jgi:hypothetical protein
VDVNERRSRASFSGCNAAYYDPPAATAHLRHRASAETCNAEVKEAPSTTFDSNIFSRGPTNLVGSTVYKSAGSFTPEQQWSAIGRTSISHRPGGGGHAVSAGPRCFPRGLQLSTLLMIRDPRRIGEANRLPSPKGPFAIYMCLYWLRRLQWHLGAYPTERPYK